MGHVGRPVGPITNNSPSLAAAAALEMYERYSKGFVTSLLSFSVLSFELSLTSLQNKNHNKELKRQYDKSPLSFWSRRNATAHYPKFLVQFALFVHSVKPASANCEQQFSRMSWMISKRRASITPANANKRLTIANQLPQKRRLLDLCEERKVKRQRLSLVKSLFEIK